MLPRISDVNFGHVTFCLPICAQEWHVPLLGWEHLLLSLQLTGVQIAAVLKAWVPKGGQQ